MRSGVGRWTFPSCCTDEHIHEWSSFCKAMFLLPPQPLMPFLSRNQSTSNVFGELVSSLPWGWIPQHHRHANEGISSCIILKYLPVTESGPTRNVQPVEPCRNLLNLSGHRLWLSSLLSFVYPSIPEIDAFAKFLYYFRKRSLLL